HHDNAYAWAERRKLETHPKTGAAQIVEIREKVQEVVVPVYVQQELPAPPKPKLFADKTDDELLGYGVPAEWLGDVRQADEDSLLVLADRLPGEASEALLELATGGKPRVTPSPVTPVANPFEHPDALRRFRVVADVEELKLALESPWEKWTVFLHPEQRQVVERSYAGPARVTGSAGTGKTVVALHRAVHLVRSHPESRVLLGTFSEPLANALKIGLRRLVGSDPVLAERLDVHSLDAVGKRLYELSFGRRPPLATAKQVREAVKEASGQVAGHKFTLAFLLSEWREVVDAWQLDTWEKYREVVRLGRKTRLSEPQRQVLWTIFGQVRATLEKQGLLTMADLFAKVAGHLQEAKQPPFDFAVIDECQDIGVPELRFLAALGKGRPDSLFFAGDLGQRIFQQPFSWKALGVDIRGRSTTLRVNYRTSHQIRRQADRLLDSEMVDPDGNKVDRRGTVSVFNGPSPAIKVLDSSESEEQAVGEWLKERIGEGLRPHEIGVFVRSEAQLDRARRAAETAGISFRILDEKMDLASGQLALGTMHLAKGLEFRAVAVMACDDEVIPLQERISAVTDEGDLEDIYNTERHLLYVACTRARDHLLVTGAAPASEFLDDLVEK
ncbi:MAG: 3'-5' exonuclease, partial [Lentisphaeria bacterium]|nr:3'-5' exonuclease [Lentisphaeria bacterium]